MSRSGLIIEHWQRSASRALLSLFARRAVATLIAFTLAFGPPNTLARAESEVVGKLGAIIGKAFIIRDGQKLPAQKEMAVFPSDALATEPKAVVKILFADGGSFMAFENSSVKIEEYLVKQQGEKITLKSAFDIAKGKVRFFVKPGENRSNDATYKTKNAVMGIRGTSGFIDASGGSTQLVVTTGKVSVSNPANPSVSVLVPANHMTSVVGAALPTEPKLAPPELLTKLKGSAEQAAPGSGEGESEKQSAPNKSESKQKKDGDDNQGSQGSEGSKDTGDSQEKPGAKQKEEAPSQRETPKEEGSKPLKEQSGSAQVEEKPAAKNEGIKESDQRASSSTPKEASADKKQEPASASKGVGGGPSTDDGKKSEEPPLASTSTADKPKTAPGQNSVGAKPAAESSPNGLSGTSGSAAATDRSPAAVGRDRTSAGLVTQPKPAAPPPDAVPVRKVTVFSQDGSSSVSVGDQSLSRMASKIDTGVVPQPANRAAPTTAPAAVPAAQVTGAAAAVQQVQSVTKTQKIQEQIKNSVTKVIDQTTSVVEAVKAAPVATPPTVVAPTSKSVKVKIILPGQ